MTAEMAQLVADAVNEIACSYITIDSVTPEGTFKYWATVDGETKLYGNSRAKLMMEQWQRGINH